MAQNMDNISVRLKMRSIKELKDWCIKNDQKPTEVIRKLVEGFLAVIDNMC